MKPFLKSVAEYTFANYPDSLHSLSLVFPNKRARLYFNRYLSEIADKPVFAPRYYTISEYMQEMSDVQVADQLTLLFTLYDVFVSITGTNESFDDFLFYCEMLLADFDDIDKYLVDPNILFTNLADLKDINNYFEYLEESQIEAIKQFWKTFSETKQSDEKQQFGDLWRVLFNIYAEFNSVLDKKGLSYEGKAFRSAVSNIDTSIKNLPTNDVFFIGFNALNVCETKLFNYLKKQNKAHFFWDYDDYYIQKKEYHEAAFFLGDLIKEYPSPAGFTFESNLTDSGRQIKIYEISTTTGQAKVVPMILKELQANNGEELIKTAITLADESLLMPVLNSIPSDIPEINISMGYPLRQTLSYNMVGLLLELQLNKKIQGNRAETFYHKDVLKIMQNALLHAFRNKKSRDFAKEITDKNLIYISSEKLKDINPLFDTIFQENILVKNFIPYLISVLQALPGFQSDAGFNQIETEASGRIIAQLKRFRDVLSETHTDYNFRSLIRLIGKFLQGTSVPFSGEPLSGLQIMGILETRTLDFDNLIVLSMNEGVFPKSGNVPSIIPYALRKANKMPTIEHQDSIYAYYFYRLLHRAKNVYLVHSTSGNDMKAAEPSRFLKQIMVEDAFQTNFQKIIYRLFPIEKREIEITKTNEIREQLIRKYSSTSGKTLSPSAINTYLNCSLRFYFRYVSEIEEPEDVFESIEANILGNILHKAMEKLYTPFLGKEMAKEGLTSSYKNSEAINQAVDEAFWYAYFMEEGPFTGKDTLKLSGKNILIREVIETYVKNIIQHDMEKVPFVVKALENHQSIDMEIDDSLKINIGGIIDRIDTTNNLIRIIDYKTGMFKGSVDSIEDLFGQEPGKRSDAVFQILLYSMIKSRQNPGVQISPELYFVRNMRQEDYSSKPEIKENKGATQLNHFSQVEVEFSHKIKTALASIFSVEGTFHQTGELKYCEHCPYHLICSR